MDLNHKSIIISRTDSIGDVMLTLPICTWIKTRYPNAKIIFLGKGYTRPIVEAHKDVDEYVDWNDFKNIDSDEQIEKFKTLAASAIIHVFPNKHIASLAKKAKIEMRIGTSHRLYHLTTCNHRPNFTRKNSPLHESQLNHELLRPLGLTELPSLEEIISKTDRFSPVKVGLPKDYNELEDYTILHPKSQGSAMEWPIENYMNLARELIAQGRQVVFTGTKEEGDLFRAQIPIDAKVFDTTGKLTLVELMELIRGAKNLVACSTGPLHIAGYLGVNTIGLYSPKRPIHPGRWKALGERVNILVFDENCPRCSQGKDCNCIKKISIEQVKEKLV